MTSPGQVLGVLGYPPPPLLSPCNRLAAPPSLASRSIVATFTSSSSSQHLGRYPDGDGDGDGDSDGADNKTNNHVMPPTTRAPTSVFASTPAYKFPWHISVLLLTLKSSGRGTEKVN
ncbi:hypothetical protein J7T55_004099 [Diaporthe amygdali]|uniref:uncharacterized protein n=1 Tax=Phomopsis amygdali TaxID=1214568 RepID=UPI0022FF13FE|nr:uncharacterized protein J7T55_004099 [Diaporthe amygdali]KAJ0115930.1 hypothetical protein J7T55_004099 [Diaporthe amygdali]